MSRYITDPELDALFDGASSSVVRLERLPYYAGADDDVAAWLATGALPDRSPATDGYLHEVVDHRAGGVRRARLRVVSDPATDYERWELTQLAANDDAGETTRVISHARVQQLPADFWAFDRRAVVFMHYDAAGEVAQLELVDDPREVTELLHTFALVWASAAPIAEHDTAAAVSRAG